MPRISSIDNGRFKGTIIIDSRENLWYTFAGLTADVADGGGSINVPFRRGTLVSGDYSLAGYEDKISIERKELSDCFGTIGQGRERFERELARLNVMEFAAVVVEASWRDVLETPPPYSDLSPKTVFRSVIAWQQRFPRVHWLLMEHRRLAEVTTFRILERFWKDKQLAGSATGDAA